MNWEMIRNLGDLVLAAVTIALGFQLKRRRDDVNVGGEVRVEGHVQTTERSPYVTEIRLNERLRSYATREDIAIVKAQIEQHFDGKFSELHLSRRQDVGKLHDKIDAISGKQGELVGKMEILVQQMRDLASSVTGGSRR